MSSLGVSTFENASDRRPIPAMATTGADLLGRDPIIGVSQDHRCNGFAHADAFEVRRKTSPKAVLSLPLHSGSPEQLFYLPPIQPIEIERVPSTVREDRSRDRVAASCAVFFEHCTYLRDEWHDGF